MNDKMNKPEWLTPELEEKASAMLDPVRAHALSGTVNAKLFRDVLFDDGVYEITRDSAKTPMQFANSMDNDDPNLVHMSELAAAVAWMTDEKIKFFYDSRATGESTLFHVTPGQTPDDIQNQFHDDMQKHAAEMAKKADNTGKKHEIAACQTTMREHLTAELNQLGAFTVTPVKSVARTGLHQAYHITFAGHHSREQLSTYADRIYGMCTAAESAFRTQTASLQTPEIDRQRNVVMAGVLPGSASTLLVHIPEHYKLCTDTFAQLPQEHQPDKGFSR